MNGQKQEKKERMIFEHQKLLCTWGTPHPRCTSADQWWHYKSLF